MKTMEEITNRDETNGRFLKTHGLANTRLYCIWSGIKNRCYNNEKEEKRYTYKGGNYTLSELSKITGISMQTLLYRIKKGWNLENIGKEVRKSEIIR